MTQLNTFSMICQNKVPFSLFGELNPSNMNCLGGNVLTMKKTSLLLSTFSFSILNLLLIELMFKWVNIEEFRFFLYFLYNATSLHTPSPSSRLTPPPPPSVLRWGRLVEDFSVFSQSCKLAKDLKPVQETSAPGNC